jgi:hypothetical protein
MQFIYSEQKYYSLRIEAIHIFPSDDDTLLSSSSFSLNSNLLIQELKKYFIVQSRNHLKTRLIWKEQQEQKKNSTILYCESAIYSDETIKTVVQTCLAKAFFLLFKKTKMKYQHQQPKERDEKDFDAFVQYKLMRFSKFQVNCCRRSLE